MEREQEITKLINVLRKTARTAQQAAWVGKDDPAAATHSARQYNRVLARLTELDPSAAPLFEPLPEAASLSVVALACRQLAAYFEDETGGAAGWGFIYDAAFDPESFKEFWRKSAKDIEDLGEHIRESIERWAQQHKGPHTADEKEE